MRIVALILVFLAAPAVAATCVPRDVMVQRLAARYGEVRQGFGLGANGQMIEIYASALTGSWTIIRVSVWGMACIVDSGSAFHRIAAPPPASSGTPL